MNNATVYIEEMTARYVYAATRFMPTGQRRDSKLELEGLIGDMLEARTNGRPATEKDIDVVLTELGRPGSFFRKSEGEQYLIGPELYPTYAQVAKIVAAATAGGITIASLVLTWMGQLQGIGILFSYASMLASSIFMGWGFITFLFALAQWRGGKLKSKLTHQPWNLADLPTVPQSREKISKADSIADIVFTVIAMLLFVFFSLQVGAVLSLTGAQGSVTVTFFDEKMLASALPFILISMLLGIARECFCLIEGRYTMRLAGVTMVVNGISLLLWTVALWIYPIFNPNFAANILLAFPDLAEVSWVFSNLPTVFFCVLVFAHLLDCAVTLFRAWRYRETA